MRIRRRRIFLFASFVLMATVSVFFTIQGKKHPAIHNEMLMQSGQDQRVLHDLSHASEQEIYGALVRTAKQGQPYAFSVAHQLINSPSLIIRRASIRAIGFSETREPWISSAFDEALGSSEPSLREEAILSLGARPGPVRTKKLETFLKSGLASPQDKILACAALYGISASASEKRFSLQLLLSFTGDTYAGEIRIAALSQALSIAPQASEVNTHVQHWIESRVLPEAWPMIFQHLGVSDKPLANQLFQKIVDDTKIETRIAALRVIPTFCPEKRWDVILNAYQRESEEIAIQSVITTILAMPGSSAEEALLRLSGDTKLDSKKRQRAHEALLRLRQSPGLVTDPCAYAPGELHPPGFTALKPSSPVESSIKR